MDVTAKYAVPDGATARLEQAQQHLRIAEEILSRAVAEYALPHATELRRIVYHALLSSADASRHLQMALADAMKSERVY